MDSENSSLATSSYGKFSKLVASKRASFLTTYRRNQEWSLPDSLIYYIAKNPSSSKVYEKLIKSCKHFFIKNPLLIIKCLSIHYVKGEWSTYFNYKGVGLQNITSKIWVIDELIIDGDEGGPQFPISFLTSKLYQFDTKIVFFTYQNIALDDLILLASKCEGIDLRMVTVKDENGGVITLEKIFAALPNIKDFYYEMEDMPADIITAKTVQKLVQLPQFCNLSYFDLSYVPDSFDIDAFHCYIKKNKQTKIRLHFDHHQNRLQEIVNEIIETEEHDYLVPMIVFPGQDRAAYKKLRHLHDYT